MSELVTVALIAAAAPTITALAAWHQARQVRKKTDLLVTKADAIHELTNSNLTAVKAELVVAQQVIDDLRRALIRQE